MKIKKHLVVKKEYQGRILLLNIPSIGRIKVDTDNLRKDKQFYLDNGLGYLFEEVEIQPIEEVIEVIEKQGIKEEEDICCGCDEYVDECTCEDYKGTLEIKETNPKNKKKK